MNPIMWYLYAYCVTSTAIKYTHILIMNIIKYMESRFSAFELVLTA